MDPNENLEEQIKLAKRIRYAIETQSFIGTESADRLAELVLALDEWLKNGGFTPRSWRTGNRV